MRINKNEILLKNKGRIPVVILVLLLCVPLNNSQAQPSPPSEQTFILAGSKNTFPNVDINDASAAIKIWGAELQKNLKMGLSFDLMIFDNAEEITNYPDKDDLGLIILNSVDYLNIKSNMHLYPVLIALDRNEVYKSFVILTRNDQIEELKDLKDKKLGLPKIFFNPIPDMWLQVKLSQDKLGEIRKFFNEIREYDKESEAILSVFFGQNDVCVVSKPAFETMNELNPQVGEKLKLLAESPGYITGISCLSENSKDFSYSKRFLDACLNLSVYTAGRQILTLMKTEKVGVFKPEYLNTIAQLLKEYNTLSRKRK